MENIFMGRLPKKPGGLINWKLVQSETERLLKVMDVRINPKSKIMHLPMWQRQVVEICKALSQDPKVLILDEPTSALAKAEVEKLFAAIRKVKENDVIIIYISHKLAGEFLHLCLHGAGRAARRLQPHSGAAGRKDHRGIDHGKDRFHDNKRFVYALYGRTFQ